MEQNVCNNDDVFSGHGIEISLLDDDNFHKIRETVTRIGVASKREKTLYQSVHLLHKRGRYALMHFKELFELDGRESNYCTEDEARRNRIALLLQEWGLVRILHPEKLTNVAPMSRIKVLAHKEKDSWRLEPKHSLGSRR